MRVPAWSVLVGLFLVAPGAVAGDAQPEKIIEVSNPTYLVWDIAPLGIEVHTADLLRDMLVLELGKMLGAQLVTAHREITPLVRKEVDDCGRTMSCFAEIGGAIGVDRVIMGVATTLGDAYNLNLKMIDVRTGMVAAKATASLQGERDGMLDAIQTLVFDLIDPALLKGSLVVDIAMDDVNVYVDGIMVGATPLTSPIHGLTTGEHTLKLSSHVMKDYFTFFTIEVGKTAMVRVDPEAIAALEASFEAVEAPLYKRWWFWTIIGGVAAVAAAGTVAGVTMGNNGPVVPSSSLGTVDLRQ